MAGFPSSGDPPRSFQESWYHDAAKHVKKTTENKRDWLVYSPRHDCMYCFWCLMFIPVTTPFYEANWTQTGVSNWKKGLQKVREHEVTDIHLSAAFRFSSFISSQNIKKCLAESALITSQKRKKKIDDNRKSMTSSLNITLFLCRQILAFRGHNEDSASHNKGNFLELSDLIANYDLTLARQLKENPKYSNYRSPAAQNEMIYSLAEVLRKDIRNEIKAANIFSLLIDETADVSKVEQVSFVFRYALNGEIFETFLTYKDVTSTTGKNLFETTKGVLDANGFRIDDLRALGTDGAANMQGEYKGVKARVAEVNPFAKSVHCACHALNLVLVQACRGSIEVKLFFATLEELYSFIEASPKRHDQFKKAQEELELVPVVSLKRHAATRWESHSKVLKDVKATYPAIVRMLQEVTRKETASDVVSKANGLLTYSMTFEFVLMIVVFDAILQQTSILSKTLQGSTIDLHEAFQLVDSCVRNLRSLRDEALLEEFIQQARNIAEKADVHTSFAEKRSRKKKRQFDERSSDDVTTDPAAHFKREVYYSSLDVIDHQMNERFGKNRDVMAAFGCLSPESLLNGSPSENRASLEKIFKEYGPDGSGDVKREVFHEYALFQERFKENGGIEISMRKRISVKKRKRRIFRWEVQQGKCTSPKHLFKFLYSSKLHKVYPNLYKLYQVFLTIPVTTAEAERSFSKLKLIKTHQRSRMVQQRTTDLALVSIERQREIDIDKAIDVFATIKNRRKDFIL